MNKKTIRQGQDSYYCWQSESGVVMQSYPIPDAGIPHAIVGGTIQFICTATIPSMTDGSPGTNLILFDWWDLRRPSTISGGRTALLVQDCTIILGSGITQANNPTMTAGTMQTGLRVFTTTLDGAQTVKGISQLTLPLGLDATPKTLSWGVFLLNPQLVGRRTAAFGGGSGSYTKVGLNVAANGGDITSGDVRVVVTACEV